MKFGEVLRTFAEWFEREGVRWAVAGGLALNAWGSGRATFDLDVLVDGARQRDVIRQAEVFGYTTLHQSHGYSNHLGLDGVDRVDFIYLYGDSADQVFSATSIRDARGTLVPVPKPEHLAAMKIAAIHDRPIRVLTDLDDISHLLRVPGVDEDEIREYFVRYGLLELYDALKKRF